MNRKLKRIRTVWSRRQHCELLFDCLYVLADRGDDLVDAFDLLSTLNIGHGHSQVLVEADCTAGLHFIF